MKEQENGGVDSGPTLSEKLDTGTNPSYDYLLNSRKRNYSDLERECLAYMADHSFPIDKLICDDSWQRLSTDGGQDEDEWYIGKTAVSAKGYPLIMCTFGTWAGGHKIYGTYKSWEQDVDVPDHEKKEIKKQFTEWERKNEQRKTEEEKKRIENARAAWKMARTEPTDPDHLSYLKRKEIDKHNVRFSYACFNDGTKKEPKWIKHPTIVFALKNIEDEIQAVQHIRSDGEKRIYGPKKGNFCQIGEIASDSLIYVSEGFGTAHTVHKAKNQPVIVAIDCGNLELVIKAMRTKYPRHEIIIAGDDDIETEGNPGRSHAEEVAKKFNCRTFFPSFPKDLFLTSKDGRKKKPKDWNDVHIHCGGIEEVRRQLRQCEETHLQEIWGELIPFSSELLPVPKFDPELLPPAFREYVVDAAERMQCPPEFIGIGLIVMFSSIIGAGCAIRPHRIDDWTVIPNLWGAIIGIPSIKKSPALNAAMAPMASLEREAEKEFKENKAKAEVDKIEFESRKKIIKSELEKAIKDDNEEAIELLRSKLMFLEKEETPAKSKRYKTNDTTVEKLQELLTDNPRGLLQYNDELMGFLASLEKEGREGTRAFYLEAWNGWSKNPYQTDRIMRGSNSCNPCISVLGAIQPSKLRIYLRNTLDKIGNDGFIQRFQLLVYPDAPKDWKLIDRAPNRAALHKIEEIATRITISDFISLGATTEEDFPLPIFRFQNEAQDFFHDWLKKLELKLIELGDGLIPQHLSKYRSLVPSLSLIYYLSRATTVVESHGVSLDEVQRAAKLCDFLECHARRVYSMIDRRGVYTAKILLEKILDGELKDGFTQREAYRPQWSGLSPTEVNEALSELIEHRYLIEEEVCATAQGGRPTFKYRIRPGLTKTLQDEHDKTDNTTDSKIEAL